MIAYRGGPKVPAHNYYSVLHVVILQSFFFSDEACSIVDLLCVPSLVLLDVLFFRY